MTATATWTPSMRQRVANRVLGFLVRRGRGPDFMYLLTVTGRRTGEPHTTPVVPVRQDGTVWLVSPFGEVGWVRNVRAVGRLDLHRGGERVTYAARELDATEAVGVIRTYLSMPSERFVRDDFEVTRGSTDEAIAAEAPRHPTFALDPVL